MIKNYLKIALRNIIKAKGYSTINILGLAIGLGVSSIILIYVTFQLSFDNFHGNGEHIYRVIPWSVSQGQENQQTWTPAGLAQILENGVPEITQTCRFTSWGTTRGVLYEDRTLDNGRLALADSTFFNFFSFELLRGSANDVLDEPKEMLISESYARKSFGDEDPVGKTLLINALFEVKISGIFKDIPQNSHISFDYLVSFVTLVDIMRAFGNTRDDILTQLDSWNYSTYLMIPELKDKEDLQIRVSDYFNEFRGREPSNSSGFMIQPLREIHFTQGIRGDGARSDIRYVYGFSAIGLFILLIACFNFMNLTTARAVRRAKEVGMRKSMGANRGQLIVQFLGETILISLIATVIGIILIEFSLPVFNQVIGAKLSLGTLGSYPLLYLFAIGLVTGLVAGSYPALYLSKFTPATVLKDFTNKSGSGTIRKVLTVFQFAIASFLIIGTITVFKQLNFMKNHKLGFNKEQVVSFNVPSTHWGRKFEIVKQELSNIPAVLGVTTSNGLPGSLRSHYSYEYVNSGERIRTNINTLITDYHYLDVLGIEMKEGRNFAGAIGSDSLQAYLLNEAAVRELGLENPIDMEIEVLSQNRGKGRVVGIIKDFHYQGLQNEIEPLAVWIDRSGSNSWAVAVRITSDKIPETLASIKTVWDKHIQGLPFTYAFLDDNFDQLYRSEENVSTLLMSFSLLAIFIACLGLLGLTSFTAEQRTKEIGIRKVMGASIRQIVVLLTRDFGKLILLAFLTAIPITIYLLQSWLEGFAYRITMGAEVYLIAIGSIVLFAWLTVAYQSIKAAAANPVEALKNNE